MSRLVLCVGFVLEEVRLLDSHAPLRARFRLERAVIAPYNLRLLRCDLVLPYVNCLFILSNLANQRVLCRKLAPNKARIGQTTWPVANHPYEVTFLSWAPRGSSRCETLRNTSSIVVSEIPQSRMPRVSTILSTSR